MNYSECPYDWKSWQLPWTIGCGGNERPCFINGAWFLLVFNVEEHKYYYYNFNEDIFWTEAQFAETLEYHVGSALRFAKRINNFVGNGIETR